MVTLPGIEPGLFGLKGRRVNQFTPQGHKGDLFLNPSNHQPRTGAGYYPIVDFAPTTYFWLGSCQTYTLK